MPGRAGGAVADLLGLGHVSLLPPLSSLLLPPLDEEQQKHKRKRTKPSSQRDCSSQLDRREKKEAEKFPSQNQLLALFVSNSSYARPSSLLVFWPATLPVFRSIPAAVRRGRNREEGSIVIRTIDEKISESESRLLSGERNSAFGGFSTRRLELGAHDGRQTVDTLEP